jgi:transcriptional regulator with XRE-family HTH domain
MNMFSENLKTLRKQKGFTQEELAARLNIVRQTVSKWEKGLSVPDAELLTRLAEILEVPVSTLLGSEIPDDKEPDDIAAQLARINEQLAVKNRRSRRIWQIVAAILIALVVVNLFLVISGAIVFDRMEPDDNVQQTQYIIS